MNPRQLHYDVQQAKAVVLPGALIEAMDAREGADQAGLLVTRPALQALDAYRASVQHMPSDVAQAMEWLGYEHISEPELTPERMLLLFQQLRVHGNAWTALRVQCQQVTVGLQRHAASIEAQGSKVVALGARTRALGANQGSWESLQLAPPAALDTHDLQLLAAMGGRWCDCTGLWMIMTSRSTPCALACRPFAIPPASAWCRPLSRNAGRQGALPARQRLKT